MQYVDGVLVEGDPADEISNFVPMRRIVPLAVVISRLLVRGEVAQVVAVLDQMPEAKEQFESLQEGIYADDVDARAIFTFANVDPDVILA